ncbi:MAG: N-acetylmuramoyl-L-alanine amidase family 2, partial [Conexibacter sp.]|nr:N-acetylmuramoyl-L-alanine amidase family 2 [Conexibacter sp.]
AGGWRTLAARRAPRRFDLLGARWAGGRDGAAVGARIALRVRRPDGRWSGWITADPSEERLSRGDGATAPVWTGAAVAYQLRVSRPLRDLRVRFVAIGDPLRQLGTVTAPGAQAAASGTAAPRVVPRSEWDPNDSCRPRTTPSYGRVDLAVVHHTESLNDYTPAESAAIVLAVCRFHRDGNGWNDIGYNLLVDRFGTVFEGRAGGVEQPVTGAHAQGYNSVSTGVATIGSFMSADLPEVAMRSLARVLAWKLSVAGVPATGAITEISAGGPLNSHPSGEAVRLQRISGHRDGDDTDCPGDALYAQLPRLRALTAAIGVGRVDRLTISPVARTLSPGGPLQVTGRLALADGQRPVGTALEVQQLVGGAWVAAAGVKTASDGAWAAGVPVVRNGRFRVAYRAGALISPTISVRVEPRVSVHVAPLHVAPGQRLAVTGTTAPAKGRVRLLVERKLPGRYVRVRAVAAPTGAGGRPGAYRVALALPRVGLYRFSVTTAADADNAAGSSAPAYARAAPRPQGGASPR